MFLTRWRWLPAVLGLTALLAATPSYAAAPPLPRPPAPHPCRYVLGFAAIHDQLGSVVGDCTDDEHFAPNGDSLQHTTTGLLAWIKADNLAKFTNGYQTWVQGPGGLVSRFDDEWYEWEAYPRQTNGVAVVENPEAPHSPTEVDLGPLIHIDQTMNNCGPAALAEVLRYYGVTVSQQSLRNVLRPPDDAYGMLTGPVTPWAHTIGFGAVVAKHGTDAVIKRLVHAGLPVIVEQDVSASDHALHYRAIEGYDDARSQFIAADTLLGPRHAISYPEFDQIWNVTAKTFIVLYPAYKQPAVNAALAA